MRFHLRHTEPERPQQRRLGDGEAGWITAGRQSFSDFSIGSLVPVVFERYARILHPAWSGPDMPIRWEGVARWSGRTIHALAQWESLSRPSRATGPRPYVEPPRTGGLPPHQLATLCESLARATSTRERCFIGVWEGYGWLDWADLAASSELRLDQRTFLVSEGPISLAAHVAWRLPGGRRTPEAPTILWPADHAWFVASDTDLDSTYLGGSDALIGSLLTEPGLEAWPVNAADRITFDSDSSNGT
jgi:hypothetical protein